MRPLSRLSPAQADRLREAAFTHPEVGATLRGEQPTGYRIVDTSARVGAAADLDRLAARLLAWEVQRGAGLRVAASGTTVEPRGTVVLGLGVGPLRVSAPCRVVDVVSEPDRRGFAYGTLPGHPEVGEELFALERHGSDVRLVVRAFSRPATALTRAAGPLGGWAQDRITRRYLRALR